MGYYMANKKLGSNSNPIDDHDFWFAPEATYDQITNNSKIPPLTFLNCMASHCVNLHTLNVALSCYDNNISMSLFVK